MRALFFAATLLLAFLSGPGHAQLADEEAGETDVTNPSDTSWRYYVDQMNRFPDRIGIICVNAYLLDKTGDHQASRAFFEECARRGNPPAMIYLAYLLEGGNGTPPDPVAATRWLRRAAETGYPVAQLHYGLALLQGHGIARDEEQGRDWVRKAAAQHDKDAMALVENGFKVGAAEPRTPQGANPNKATSGSSLLPREPTGNELSYEMQLTSDRRMKCLYGYAAEKTGDHEAARRIFEDCIDRWNDVYSMIWLAAMYENGSGVPRDVAKATALLKRGAETHDDAGYSSLARYHYGKALCEGDGTERDPVQCRRYLAIAAGEGIKEAEAYLETLGSAGQ